MTTNYVIMAMSRSGHHALVNWIAKQSTGIVKYYGDPYPHISDTNLGRFRNVNGNSFLGPRTLRDQAENTDPARFENFTKYLGTDEVNIYSIGDFDPDNFHSYDLPNFKEVQEADKTYFISFVRDPYNWLASTIAIGHDYSSRRIEIWKRQVLAAQRTWIAQHTDPAFPIFGVIYNRWASDQGYRKQLAETFGLTFTDAGIDDVPNYGNGSTWDKRTFHGRAQEMSVNERWKNLRDDQRFLSAVDDRELVEWSEMYFDFPNPLVGA